MFGKFRQACQKCIENIRKIQIIIQDLQLAEISKKQKYSMGFCLLNTASFVSAHAIFFQQSGSFSKKCRKKLIQNVSETPKIVISRVVTIKGHEIGTCNFLKICLKGLSIWIHNLQKITVFTNIVSLSLKQRIGYSSYYLL